MRIAALALLVVVLLPTQASGLPLPLTAGCGGTAPALTSCSAGSQTAVALSVTIGMGSDAEGHYRGTVEARVDHETGTLIMRCDSTGEPGADPTCQATGPILLAGDVQFSCASYELGTRTPGGRGPWDCQLAIAV